MDINELLSVIEKVQERYPHCDVYFEENELHLGEEREPNCWYVFAKVTSQGNIVEC